MYRDIVGSQPCGDKHIFWMVLCLLCVAVALSAEESIGLRHGIAMHGEPKYAPGFKHFDYVRADAPKGGILRLAKVGSFDSLNPFIINGVPGEGDRLVFETLLARSFDEPFSLYGLIAETIEMPADRSWVIFNLNPKARFHDGKPVTADDVLFSWEILKTKGRPHTRTYYSRAEKAERLGERRVRFTFGPQGNWEMPLILGLMPIVSKSYWSTRDFAKTTLEPAVGSGPYRIVEVDPGRAITYRRDPNHWGRDLAVNVGRYNFDTIRYDYYRDSNIALEAFKAGEYDFRFEPDAARWATGYKHPAVNEGRIVLEEIAHRRPVGMEALVLNTRRAQFKDRRVRQALAYVFDFEWLNRTLYHGAYTRTSSYFDNSELAADPPISSQEQALLEPHRKSLPPEVFTAVYESPVTDGSGNIRRNLREATRLLAEAGWRIRYGRLVDAEGRAMEFEILLVKPWHERMLMSFVRNLKRVGIKARLRTVDSAQYENRLASFDFDAIVYWWGESLSPGNEQEIYWSSKAAATQGSRNYANIRLRAVDELIEHIADARDRESLITATRALDRVLLWGHYVIPLFHLTADRVAYWNKLRRPKVTPVYGTTTDLWWHVAGKAPARN